MTRSIMDAYRALLPERNPEAAVHFHADGLNGEPAVCYDARCGRPALDAG
jgi:hypothetical protein